MTAWIILGLLGTSMAWLLLHFIQRTTKAEAKLEAEKKTSAIKTKQMDIAARPPDSLDALLSRMRDGKL